MTSFNRSTSRRLKKLTQIPSVWEGDRRPLSSTTPSRDRDSQGECILWVDGSQGIVRGMDVIAPDAGPEAVVRTLMQAMEHPQSPAKPARPQKIVVRDREIQFYLRGVLQDLEITIDYAPELPLIDELFRSFTDILDSQVPDLPPQYAQVLQDKAWEIWQAAPWKFLEEQQILSLEINHWDVGTIYASVMGMLGMEYGILFYRSEESLKQFRAAVLRDEDSTPGLEEAFLKQDCLFLTFEPIEEREENVDEDLADFPVEEIQAVFGNIHPLEGLRSVLYEEEAMTVLVALDSFIRFIRDHHRQLQSIDFPQLSRRYRIWVPDEDAATKSLSITVATLPQLATELEEMVDWEPPELSSYGVADESDLKMFHSLRDDLIPKNSFLSLGVIPWDMLEHLRQEAIYHSEGEIKPTGDGLPVILIQTSRPKAMTVIENIQASGGLKAICFHSGMDTFDGDRYDLGLLQTQDNELFLFGEFLDRDPVHIEARKKWHQRCENTSGCCGLIIAKGLTGASRGNPQLRDMMALFEAHALSPERLAQQILPLQHST
jgi:hypothetical protein